MIHFLLGFGLYAGGENVSFSCRYCPKERLLRNSLRLVGIEFGSLRLLAGHSDMELGKEEGISF